MNQKKLQKQIEKMNLDNPLEFTRKLVAPLCKKKLNEHIINCKECNTCKNYNKKTAIGNPNANYFTINDNATDDENINEFLNSILTAVDIDLNNVFIINSISCILKRNFNNDSMIRLPNRQEMNNCKYFVEYALDFVKPRVIICMGTTSLAMFKKDMSIEDTRGTFIEINGYKTMVTRSAKDIFTMSEIYSEEEAQEYVDELVQDVSKAKEYIDLLRRK